jgi:hypothetical protein
MINNELLTDLDLQAVLKTFIGTEGYYKHRIINGMSILLTDGCHFFRQQADARWLFDLIISYQLKLKREEFQVWKLEKQEDSTWLLTCTDGNDNPLVMHTIPYAELPVGSIEIYLKDGVAMLPSEY